MSHKTARPYDACTAHVISHTHWDREWYLTTEQYRFRLVRMLDRVIDLLQHDPDWHSFFLDGQTQALTDYLEVRPEQAGAVEKLIRRDKLRIGPWCVQPDEQLISGEATVRNLLFGRADCDGFGGGEAVGYLADNFGHSSQMPQILSGFGLDNAVFWRGYDENQIPCAEMNWEGADGTVILAVLLVRGYSNAAGFGPLTTDDQRLLRNLPVVKRLSRTGLLPVTDGIDHSLPPLKLRDVLTTISNSFPGLDVRHSGWSELLAAVRPFRSTLPELQGELTWCPGLESTFSNRLAQKQANQYCESLLTAVAEPLAALASLGGCRYPDGFLRRAWRMMVKNAAHDSIGGAHADAVARDVSHRFVRAREIAEGVAAAAIDALLGMDAGCQEPVSSGRLALYNPTPAPLSGVVEVTVDLPDPHGRDWRYHSFAGLALYDGRRRMPVHILDDQPTLHPVYHERVIPKIRNTRTLRVLTEVADLPPLGIKTFTFMPGDQTPQANILVAEDRAAAPLPPPAVLLSPGPGVLRNERIEVRVHNDGSFDLTLLNGNYTFTGLNALVDAQDNGNQYNFAYPKNRAAATPAHGRLVTILNSPLRAVIRVETEIDLFDERVNTPELLARRMGNNAAVVTCPLTVEIGINRGCERVELAVVLDNRGAGHRLRARFGPAGEDSRLRVSTPFDLVDRTPSRNAGRSRGITQRQMDELKGSGMQGFLVVDGAAAGFALAARGLYEYQHNRAGENIELTLLRSAGTINYGFEGWGTSEAGFLPGPCRMEYAFRPFLGEFYADSALADIDAFLVPVQSRQYPAGAEVAVRGPVLLDSRLRFSAFKRAETGSSLIFRFFNSSEEIVSATVPLGRMYAKVRQCRLDETPDGRTWEEVDAVALDVPPKRVITLELTSEATL